MKIKLNEMSTKIYFKIKDIQIDNIFVLILSKLIE